MERRYTPSGLPVVERRVIETKIAEYSIDRKEYFLGEFERIKEENPLVAALIQAHAEDSSDKKRLLAATICLYQILEAQSQINRAIENPSRS